MPRKTVKPPYLALSIFSEGVNMLSVVTEKPVAQTSKYFGATMKVKKDANRLGLCITLLEVARELAEGHFYLKDLIKSCIQECVEADLLVKRLVETGADDELPF